MHFSNVLKRQFVFLIQVAALCGVALYSIHTSLRLHKKVEQVKDELQRKHLETYSVLNTFVAEPPPFDMKDDFFSSKAWLLPGGDLYYRILKLEHLKYLRRLEGDLHRGSPSIGEEDLRAETLHLWCSVFFQMALIIMVFSFSLKRAVGDMIAKVRAALPCCSRWWQASWLG